MQTSPSQSPFFNAVMAAPMVRVSTLAFRLLCAHHGSSLVFTEELVAAKLMKCKRRYLPQVDFLLQHEKVPEKYSSVLKQLETLIRGDDDADKNDDDNNNNISQILFKWIQQFPFLKEVIFAGRVEGIYLGHQQPSKKQQQKASNAAETEEPSEQGEIVFTTLANLINTTHQQQNNSTSNDDHDGNIDSSSSSSFESKLKNHCRYQLKFPKKEAGKPLVGQIGASDPDVAANGFELLAPFVAACDTNMGCPKAFSVKNGMGAALMANKEGAAKILKTLSERFPHLPISYKTRLFEDLKDSLEHLQTCFAATGNRLHAFTLHSRNRPQRSETAPLYSDASKFVQMIRSDENLKNLCLIFNGSVAMRPIPDHHDHVDDEISKEDNVAAAVSTTTTTTEEKKEIDLLLSDSLCGNTNILKSVSSFGFNGALLARSSMWKPSVFVDPPSSLPSLATAVESAASPSLSSSSSSSSGSHVVDTLIREFQNLAIVYAACGDQVRLFKYHLTRAVPEYQSAEGVHGRGEDVKKLANELNQSIFIPTLTDFAKALRFSEEESDAMNWMTDFVNWRRSLASLVVEECWNPHNPSEDAVVNMSDMRTSRRESDVAPTTTTSALPNRRERNEEEK